jgi:hypothetical protein
LREVKLSAVDEGEKTIMRGRDPRMRPPPRQRGKEQGRKWIVGNDAWKKVNLSYKKKAIFLYSFRSARMPGTSVA